MGLSYQAFGGSVTGSVPGVTPGTAFYGLVPGDARGLTRASSLSYTTGNTAHTLAIMRPIGRTTVASAAIANTNTVTLTADPGPAGNLLGANDQLVIQHTDNTYGQYNVTAFNATSKVATISPNTVSAIASGKKVWNYGINTDTDPVSGSAHPKFPVPATATTVLSFNAGGVAGWNFQDPLLVYSPNTTGNGTLNYVEYGYTKE